MRALATTRRNSPQIAALIQSNPNPILIRIRIRILTRVRAGTVLLIVFGLSIPKRLGRGRLKKRFPRFPSRLKH